MDRESYIGPGRFTYHSCLACIVVCSHTTTLPRQIVTLWMNFYEILGGLALGERTFGFGMVFIWLADFTFSVGAFWDRDSRSWWSNMLANVLFGLVNTMS